MSRDKKKKHLYPGNEHLLYMSDLPDYFTIKFPNMLKRLKEDIPVLDDQTKACIQLIAAVFWTVIQDVENYTILGKHRSEASQAISWLFSENTKLGSAIWYNSLLDYDILTPCQKRVRLLMNYGSPEDRKHKRDTAIILGEDIPVHTIPQRWLNKIF